MQFPHNAGDQGTRKRMPMWHRIVPRGGFASHVLTLSSGTVMAQAGIVLFAPMLSRLYGPEAFAQYALFSVFASLAAILATGRYELALMLPEQDDDARSLLALATLLPAAVMSVTCLAVGAYQVLGGGLASWVWLVPPGTLVLAWYVVGARWQARKHRFRCIAISEFVASMLALAIQLIVGAFSLSPDGMPLILGQIIGRGLCLPILCAGMASDWAGHGVPVHIRGLAATALRYRHFPLFSCGSSFVGKANQELPKLLLGSLFGPQSLGYFSLSMRVLGTPASMIGQAFGDAFFPRISAYRSDGKYTKRLLLRACSLLVVMILPPAIVLFFWADSIFAVVFGGQWATSGVYARLLIPMFVGQFVVQPIAMSMHAFEKQHAVLVWQIVGMVVYLTIFVVGSSFGSLESTLLAYSLTSAALWLVYLAMTLYYAHQRSTGRRAGDMDAESQVPACAA